MPQWFLISCVLYIVCCWRSFETDSNLLQFYSVFGLHQNNPNKSKTSSSINFEAFLFSYIYRGNFNRLKKHGSLKQLFHLHKNKNRIWMESNFIHSMQNNNNINIKSIFSTDFVFLVLNPMFQLGSLFKHWAKVI